jgi:tRNA pseudouridine38-40 synthase
MRFAIGIEYDGSEFLGWQSQREQPTVQDTLEAALSRVANHSVRLHCCGRTDAGVHALGQVAHFDSESIRSERSWVLGINSNLPPTISVLWIRETDEEFHARFSAWSRSYRYQVLNRWIRPALKSRQVCWHKTPLNDGLMHESAQSLLGEHDFTSYRALACQARHPIREIQEISVSREGNILRIDVTANGFLYHMVRNIVGSLLAVGAGDKPVTWLAELLEERNRSLAAATAPAAGLYFVSARYPAQYQLPTVAADFPRGSDRS